MNRVTVKVQTNRAEKAIREAHPRLVKKTVPMGGGWWHITLECKANGATALAKLKERFPWARFSQWVHCQALTSATGKPLECPVPAVRSVWPDMALGVLRDALVLCELAGVTVVASLDGVHEPILQIGRENGQVTLWSGDDHGGQDYLNVAAVDLAIQTYHRRGKP